MCTRLIYLLVSVQTTLAQQLCFVRATSTVRRDALAVMPAVSHKECNIRCIDTPDCEACMFYADRKRCVMMGTQRAPIPGACPVPYTCYEKKYSGCSVCGSPPDSQLNASYASGPCSRASDVIRAPRSGLGFPCTIPAVGQPDRRIVLDVIKHDGTHQVIENYSGVGISWDPTICSWYVLMGRIRLYFESASCVLPPPTPLAPSCACGLLPKEPAMTGQTLHPTRPTPLYDPSYACPIGRIQVVYHHMPALANGDYRRSHQSAYEFIYCAMGEWMMVLDSPVDPYECIAITAATCLV